MRLLLTILACLGFGLPALAAGKFEIQVNGHTRAFAVEPPMGARPAPAVIVLHGEDMTPHKMERIASFQLGASGWAEIYPEALDGQWSDGQKAEDGEPFGISDDIAFLRAIVDRLSGEGMIDPRRVFLVGTSSGGSMVLRMICDAPNVASGAAVVIAGQPDDPDCVNGPPVPLLFIHSETDPLVPFDGGPVRLPDGSSRGTVIPAVETLARFALRNRCGHFDEFDITDHFDDGTRVRLRTWRGCATPIRQYIINGAGHTWPGNRTTSRIEKALGRTSRDISATWEIEIFFKELLR